MGLNFSASIDRNIQNIKQKVNDRIYAISIDLFRLIVSKSPSPANPGPYASGLLANQWYPKLGDFSREVSDSTSNSGAASLARIASLRGGRGFFDRDNVLTLSNSVDHAYRAEYIGWPESEGWSGKSGGDRRGGPYRMVALSLQEIAARIR